MTNLQYQFFAAIIKFTQTIILQPSNDAHNKSLLAYGSISKQPAFWLSDIVFFRCLGIKRKLTCMDRYGVIIRSRLHTLMRREYTGL